MSLISSSAGFIMATEAAAERRAEGKSTFGARAWQFQEAEGIATKLANRSTDLFSGFEHSISVVVQGGTEADIRRVWYLALSTAFGRYRNAVQGLLSETAFRGEWQVTAKACKVEIFYRTNRTEQRLGRPGWGIAIGATVAGGAAAGAIIGNMLLPAGGLLIGGIIGGVIGGAAGGAGALIIDPSKQWYYLTARGPEQLTVGGDWPGWAIIGRPGPQAFTRVGVDGPPCIPGGSLETVNGTIPARASITSTTLGLPGTYREYPIFGGTDSASLQFPARVQTMLGADGTVLPANPPILPASTFGSVALPDDGRVITTADKSNPRVQPPTPPVDGNTAYTFLSLVAQALHCPCFLPTTPPCTGTLRGTIGERLFVPSTGAADNALALANVIASNPLTGIRTITPVLSVPNAGLFAQPDEEEAEGVYGCETETELSNGGGEFFPVPSFGDGGDFDTPGFGGGGDFEPPLR